MSPSTYSTDTFAVAARCLAVVSMGADRSSPAVANPAPAIGTVNWPVPQANSKMSPDACRVRSKYQDTCAVAGSSAS
jgi:hypothetical protein